MIEFEHLRLFAAVAELGSLTKASVVLGKEQSAISRQIRALESSLGGRLFHRTGRGVVPTELGERILPRVRAVLAETDMIVDQAKAPAGSIIANVRVGIIPSLSARLVRPLFFRMREAYPGIRLHFFEDYSGELDRRLDSNALDIAVLLRDTTIRPDERVLGSWEMYLVGPPGDDLTSRDEVAFSQLDRLPLILSLAPSGARIQIETLARKKGITLSVVAEVNSASVSYALVRAGAGCYLIGPATPPLTTLSRRVSAGHLQAARIVDPVISRMLTLSSTPERPSTRAEQIIMQMICDIVPELEAVGASRPDQAPTLSPEFDF